MSYILDALKKAESERHLGELPGLHTPPPAAAPLPAQGIWWRSGAAIAAMAVAVAVVGTLAWIVGAHRDDKLPQPAVVVSTSQMPASQVSASQMPASAIPTPQSAPQSTQATPVLARDLPVPPPLPKAPPSSKASDSPASAVSKEPPAVALKSIAPQRATAPSTASTGADGSGARVLTLAQLPDGLQRELPPLAVGGSMYSDSPADRMLLIDKRLFHEGDEVAPGLVLENLMPKAAVLRYKGYRFRISF